MLRKHFSNNIKLNTYESSFFIILSKTHVTVLNVLYYSEDDMGRFDFVLF